MTAPTQANHCQPSPPRARSSPPRMRRRKSRSTSEPADLEDGRALPAPPPAGHVREGQDGDRDGGRRHDDLGQLRLDLLLADPERLGERRLEIGAGDAASVGGGDGHASSFLPYDPVEYGDDSGVFGRRRSAGPAVILQPHRAMTPMARMATIR